MLTTNQGLLKCDAMATQSNAFKTKAIATFADPPLGRADSRGARSIMRTQNVKP
jgi:hypothetical protein